MAAAVVVIALAACRSGTTSEAQHERCPSGASCADATTTTEPATAPLTRVDGGGTGALVRGRGGMSEAIPALRPWCRDLDRVYREEALPLRGPLVEDAVRLIDRLQAIVSTGTGVASMRAGAQESPERGGPRRDRAARRQSLLGHSSYGPADRRPVTDRYDDGRIACDDTGIVIRWYYLWGRKRIPYRAIRHVTERQLRNLRGRWRGPGLG